MILHTIMPMDAIMHAESDNGQSTTRIIPYDNYHLEVNMLNGQAQVQRIFSTNPKDYLNPKVQPGSTVNLVE